ncbi:hypothetical protein HDV05_007569 [Chytridiales sp. JEL 0842]|nr:hypothetical protein HDV05_007569 [Chytridiales sp. JEL 0842]
MDVGKLCSGLPNLESLRLNYNRFIYPLEKSLPSDCFGKVRSLALNGTLLTWKDILEVAPYFPTLEELHLGFNEMSVLLIEDSASSTDAITFPTLRLLNLECNRLTSWTEVAELTQRHLPALEILFLNENKFEDFEANASQFKTLKTLNLSNNSIKTWMCIHSLNTLPSLTHLRLRHNPVLLNLPLPPVPSPTPNSASDPTATVGRTSQMELIARLSRLTFLNNAPITPRDRQDAELYYLSRCSQLKQDWTSHFPAASSQWTRQDWDALFESWHPRLKEIAEAQGGMPEAPPASVTSTKLKDRLAVLKIVERVEGGSGVGRVFEKKVLGTMTIRSFKVVVGRLVGVKGGGAGLRLRAVYQAGEGRGTVEKEMDDEMREVGFYDLGEGDEVWVEVL